MNLDAEPSNSQKTIPEYFDEINKNPRIHNLWTEIYEKALQEEENEAIPWPVTCENLSTLRGELLKAISSADKFKILAQESPDGSVWYNHILGKTNRLAADLLLDFIESQDYSLIVDAGTGQGNSLIKSTPTRKVIGVDISRALLKNAKSKEPTALIESDARAMPIPNNTVDCVYGFGLTHYMNSESLKTFAKEAYRILKPGRDYLDSMELAQ